MPNVFEKKQTQLYGICPSCETHSSYILLGIQRWPEQVAKQLGVPVEQAIWQCEHCKTSLMEDSIQIEDNPMSV